MIYNWCQTYIYIIYGFSYNIGICFLSLSKVSYIRIRTNCYKLTIHIYVQKSPIVNFFCKYIYRKTSNYSLHLVKVGGTERIKNYRLQKWWNKHTWHKSNTCETCLFYYNIMLNKNNEKILILNNFEIKGIRRNVLEWPTCIHMERNGTEFSFIGRLIWFTHNSLRYIWFFQFSLIFLWSFMFAWEVSFFYRYIK